MKAIPTHVSVLVDRSFSMESMWDETVSAINTFLQLQKEAEGKLRLSLATFDSHEQEKTFQPLYSNVKRKKATGLPETIFPRGGTPLYDSILAQIRAVAKTLPDEWQASLVIMTDGEENTSETSHGIVKSLIESKEKEGWMFTFLGANIDAAKTARGLGMTGSVVQYDGQTVGAAYGLASAATVDFRGTSTIGSGISDVTQKGG